MQTDQIKTLIDTPQWSLAKRPFAEACEKISNQLDACKTDGVLICSKDPWAFVGAFLAAVSTNVPIFLANPDWKESEWAQVLDQMYPAIIFGESKNVGPRSHLNDNSKLQGYIMIPSGGSSGKVRFAMHTWETLTVSAKATVSFLGAIKMNSLCVLPLYHISGLIQVVRALVTNGEVFFKPLEVIQEGYDMRNVCLSLVPTQLERLLNNPDAVNGLRTFDVVFLGGAPASSALLKKAREEKIRLSPTYGMTETASMISAMRPEDFLRGRPGVGEPLSHAKVFVDEDGTLAIQCKSLFYGYYPEMIDREATWTTSDQGGFDKEGYLHIIGRNDRMIITGGEKVDPKEVEAAILNTGLVDSVVITSKPCNEWGQRIVAIAVPVEKKLDPEKLRTQLKDSLANYKIPKDWLFVEELPYDSKGKINSSDLLKLIEDTLS